jgi:hypothetical protein
MKQTQTHMQTRALVPVQLQMQTLTLMLSQMRT